MVDKTALPTESPDRNAGPVEGAVAAAPALQPPVGPASRPRHNRGARSDLLEAREPVHREAGGYRLRLEVPDLARLRELPGSGGKSDANLGQEFFDGNAARLAAALAGEVTPPAQVRVVVDPYTRQAFLAVENRIRGIVSF